MIPMKNMKVMIVCDKNSCTSFGRLTLDISSCLKSRGFETQVVWLVTPKYFPQGSPTSDVSICAKSLYSGFFKFRSPLKKLIAKQRPDFVFFIRPELGFLIPAAKSVAKKFNASAKTVMMVHDTFAETLYTKSFKFKLINKFFIDPTKKADAFVYNSNYTKQESEKYFGVPNCGGDVIGCPVDQTLFCKPDSVLPRAERLKFFEQFGVHSAKGVCLNVSLDEPRKNLDTFFNTAALRPEVAFVRVGRLRAETASRLEAMHLNNVYHFENLPAETLVAFYRNADLFMYPSLLEGFGLPPLEALSCGTPAVSSRSSALLENLENVVPLVSKLDDAEVYASVLDAVIAGTNIVNEKAAKELLKKFSIDAFADRLEKALSI